MSWQATAYVKGLTNGVTAYEKLLLFVLADYHNTHRGAAWPSVPLLAEESLMSERNCFNLLKALEVPRAGYPLGIISRRRTGEGRGSITEYVFVELDKGEYPAPFNPAKGERKGEAKGERKGEYRDSAIRKSRGVEGTKELFCPSCENRGLKEHKGHPGAMHYCLCAVGQELQKNETGQTAHERRYGVSA